MMGLLMMMILIANMKRKRLKKIIEITKMILMMKGGKVENMNECMIDQLWK